MSFSESFEKSLRGKLSNARQPRPKPRIDPNATPAIQSPDPNHTTTTTTTTTTTNNTNDNNNDTDASPPTPTLKQPFTDFDRKSRFWTPASKPPSRTHPDSPSEYAVFYLNPNTSREALLPEGVDLSKIAPHQLPKSRYVHRFWPRAEPVSDRVMFDIGVGSEAGRIQDLGRVACEYEVGCWEEEKKGGAEEWVGVVVKGIYGTERWKVPQKWGATLQDFWLFNLLGVHSAQWGTSSQLRDFIQRMGQEEEEGDEKDKGKDKENAKVKIDMKKEQEKEMKAAEEELEWARNEAKPKMKVTWSRSILKAQDEWEKSVCEALEPGKGKTTMEVDEDKSTKPTEKKKTAFSLPAPPLLTSDIPLYLLPQKLVVHDPDNLLAVSENHHSKPKPMSHTHTYKLHLSSETEFKISEQRTALHKAWLASHNDSQSPTTFMIQASFLPPSSIATASSSSSIPAPTETELIMLDLPPHIASGLIPPPSLFQTPEAHLYLSRGRGQKGKGHHSVVWTSMLKIPRSTIQAADYPINLYEIAKTGESLRDVKKRWDMFGQDSPVRKVPGMREICNVAVAEAMKEKLRQVEMREGGKRRMVDKVEVVDPEEIFESAGSPILKIRGDSKETALKDSQWDKLVASHTPGSDDPCPYCTAASDAEDSKMASFTLTAKLSLPTDTHLVHEARNYEKFEPVLSQDWSGYYMAKPLRDPTPARAVIPRFYGFYRHDKLVDEKEEGKEGEVKSERGEEEDGYMSDILLLEDCGEPINVDELSMDERQECASLLFRFHKACWRHGSFFARNILVRTDPLSPSPSPSSLEPKARSYEQLALDYLDSRPRRTFRLIDFGRSLQIDPKTRKPLSGSWEHVTIQEEEDSAIKELKAETDAFGKWISGDFGCIVMSK